MQRYNIFAGKLEPSKLPSVIKSRNFNWLVQNEKIRFKFTVFIAEESYGFCITSQEGFSSLYVLSPHGLGLNGCICAHWEKITGSAELKQIGLFKNELTTKILNIKIPTVLAEIISSYLV